MQYGVNIDNVCTQLISTLHYRWLS